MAHLSLAELFPSNFLNESTPELNLGEEFSLCDNGNMVFHWADFHETCEVIRNRLESDPAISEEFRKKESALNRMNLIPVWIRTQRKVHQTTMFELYERYIHNSMKLALDVDPFGPLEISFISGTGPFKEMAIAECFNKNTYRDFVMLALLKDKLPKRDYRVRLKAKVLMEYGENFQKAHLIDLEQLTMNGLLMSLDSDFFLKEISHENELRILLDTQGLEGGSSKSLGELKDHLSQFAFNLMYSSKKEDAISCKLADFSVQSSFDFLKNKKVYLFVPYQHIQSERPETIRNIQNFVSHSRSLISELYKNAGVKKTA